MDMGIIHSLKCHYKYGSQDDKPEEIIEEEIIAYDDLPICDDGLNNEEENEIDNNQSSDYYEFNILLLFF